MIQKQAQIGQTFIRTHFFYYLSAVNLPHVLRYILCNNTMDTIQSKSYHRRGIKRRDESHDRIGLSWHAKNFVSLFELAVCLVIELLSLLISIRDRLFIVPACNHLVVSFPRPVVTKVTYLINEIFAR